MKKRLQSLSYGADVQDILGADSDHNTGRQLAAEFMSRSGIRNTPQVICRRRFGFSKIAVSSSGLFTGVGEWRTVTGKVVE